MLHALAYMYFYFFVSSSVCIRLTVEILLQNLVMQHVDHSAGDLIDLL